MNADQMLHHLQKENFRLETKNYYSRNMNLYTEVLLTKLENRQMVIVDMDLADLERDIQKANTAKKAQQNPAGNLN